MSDRSPIQDIDKTTFETVLKARNFEIELFWKRNNYFLLLNTAIAAGMITKADNALYSLVFSLLGLSTSYLWFRAALGSKFWQERWEFTLHRIERQFLPDAGLFDVDISKQHSEVEKSLLKGAEQRLRRSSLRDNWRDWLDRKILERPSVSRLMIVLSLIFIIFWLTGTFFFLISLFSEIGKEGIKKMWDILNSNSGALQAIFAFVIILVTGCYVILTYSLVKETKRLREVETEPKISIYLHPEERWINLMDLVICNIGRGPAYSISFEIKPDWVDSRKNGQIRQPEKGQQGFERLAYPDKAVLL